MKRGLLACVALLAAGLIEAQVVTKMTPERIREAIASWEGTGSVRHWTSRPSW